MQLLDGAVFGDTGVENDSTADVGGLRDLRILGCDLLQHAVRCGFCIDRDARRLLRRGSRLRRDKGARLRLLGAGGSSGEGGRCCDEESESGHTTYMHQTPRGSTKKRRGTECAAGRGAKAISSRLGGPDVGDCEERADKSTVQPCFSELAPALLQSHTAGVVRRSLEAEVFLVALEHGEMRHAEEVFEASAQANQLQIAMIALRVDPQPDDSAEAGAIEEGHIGQIEHDELVVVDQRTGWWTGA